MKKILLTLLLAFMLIFSIAGGAAAFAEVSMEECDKCFQTTVNGFLQQDDVESNKISAVRKPVYDINLQHLGYIYEFEIASGNGYAIIICDDGAYVAQEFVPYSDSPYALVEENETCVYINSMLYLKYNGENFCDIKTSACIPNDVLEELAQNAIQYKVSTLSGTSSVSVTVNYTARTVDSKNLSKTVPHFLNPGDLEGACGAISGGNIVGFYDRYYEDLIPNHSAGYESYGYYLYSLADSYVYDSIRQIYTDMNGTASGINETNYKNGLKTYCARKNLSCDFTQLLSSGKLSVSSIKQSIEENKPIALLLESFTTCDIIQNTNKDKLNYTVYTEAHIMTGFGYLNIDYSLPSGASQSYNFVYVSTGLAERENAYFNINYSTNINSAYKVYIH